jgi:prolyl-tRNA synthetase
VREAADALYDRMLKSGIDVILDDRDERPGAMFADWELIGVPVRVTVGERGLKEGQVEITVRRGMKTEHVPLDRAFQAVTDTLEAC